MKLTSHIYRNLSLLYWIFAHLIIYREKLCALQIGLTVLAHFDYKHWITKALCFLSQLNIKNPVFQIGTVRAAILGGQRILGWVHHSYQMHLSIEAGWQAIASHQKI